MVEQSICGRSDSPWASPLFLVEKKSGEWRPCRDYHQLNAITIPDGYQTAHIEDSTTRLHGKTIFTTLDLVRAYHLVPVAEQDIPKTAVTTPFGSFEFLAMPFGLRNAAQTFQRFIDTVLRGLDFIYCYLDDILIASAKEEKHQKYLRIVLERLANYGLSINPAKCVCKQPEIDYIGYMISSEGTRPPQARNHKLSSNNEDFWV